jgi:hypothetical protein
MSGESKNEANRSSYADLKASLWITLWGFSGNPVESVLLLVDRTKPGGTKRCTMKKAAPKSGFLKAGTAIKRFRRTQPR